MRGVARQRKEPPKTPFGAWLAQWLEDRPAVTQAAFAEDVGVSKGLITQWIGGTVPKSPNLREVARRTGEPLENLERLLYGSTAGVGERRTVNLTPDELEAMLTRAADLAVRQLLAELAASRGE